MSIDDTEMTYTDSGTGDSPVLLIHGGGLADWMTPLAAQPFLADRRVIRMVRTGHPGVTIADYARQAATLLRELGAAPAHVVAHSSGAAIALQLAAGHPSSVRTLMLLEPPLVDTLADPADLPALHAALGPAIGAAMAATARGDHAAAFDAFMTVVCGPGYRAVMDEALGKNTVDDAAAHSGGFFTGEVPALNAWVFDRASVTCPVLLVQGEASPPPVHRLVAYLARHLPDATVTTVAGANHLMPLTAPAELARLIPR